MFKAEEKNNDSILLDSVRIRFSHQNRKKYFQLFMCVQGKKDEEMMALCIEWN